MTAAPANVLDTLNGLIEAEVASVFRTVADGSPFLDKQTESVRTALVELDKLSRRHTSELARLVESLGGTPRARHTTRPDEQYLSFLSLKFLMPKLVAEKDLILTRYENAKRTIGTEHPQVLDAIGRIEQEQRQYLDVLARVAHDVTGGRFTAAAHQPPEAG